MENSGFINFGIHNLNKEINWGLKIQLTNNKINFTSLKLRYYGMFAFQIENEDLNF